MPEKIYYYQNFNIDINGTTLPMIVWGIWAGVLVAIFFAITIRAFTGGLISRLKRAEATTPDKAKTMGELGVSVVLAMLFLRDSSSVMRYVKIANREEASYSNGLNGKNWKLTIRIVGRSFSLKRAKLYLPEENRIGAETRYVCEEHPVRSFVIATAVLTAGAVFASYALPELLLMLDNFISMNS